MPNYFELNEFYFIHVNNSLKPGAVGSINFCFPCIYLQTTCISDPSLDLILIPKDLISFMKFSKPQEWKRWNAAVQWVLPRVDAGQKRLPVNFSIWSIGLPFNLFDSGQLVWPDFRLA